MENRTWLAAMMLCLMTWTAQAEFRESTVPPAPHTNPMSPSGELRFRLYRGSYIVAKGSLNGSGGHNLLIDTGSNPTVLDIGLARKLRLGGQPTGVRTLDGDMPGTMAVLSSLTAGRLTATDVRVLIADLSFISKDLDTRIDAIVGLDVLQTTDFLIDYQARQIVFGSVPDYPNSVSFETGPPFVTIKMQVEGMPMRLLVDTGAGGLLIFRERMRDPKAYSTPANLSLFRVGQDRDQIALTDIRLGSLHRTNQAAYVVRTPHESTSDFGGLVAPPALGIKQIGFDFERQLLSWK